MANCPADSFAKRRHSSVLNGAKDYPLVFLLIPGHTFFMEIRKKSMKKIVKDDNVGLILIRLYNDEIAYRLETNHMLGFAISLTKNVEGYSPSKGAQRI